jgi:hypothetical protein
MGLPLLQLAKNPPCTLPQQEAIKIDNKCVKDLVLMQKILDKAQKGIHMNLLAFRAPD